MVEGLQRRRVWDLPTRAFHWLLFVAVAAAVLTAHLGGNLMVWHQRLGILVLALLAFRLAWGLVGGHWSRFGSFIYTPAAVLRYLRGAPRAGERFDVGHNPLGALSVFMLLGLLALQVATGLVADDEIATTGPLVSLVSSAVSSRATSWHTTAGQWLLGLFVAAHLAAIVMYRLRKGQDLVGPMLHGDKWLAGDVPASRDGLVQRALALLLAAAALALAGWVNAFGA